MTRLHWRKFVNIVMLSLTGVCTVTTVAVLFLILGLLVYNGASSLSLHFFTELPKPVYEAGGGIANAIVGSARIVGTAALIGIPVGFMAGVYLAEYEDRKFAALIRYVADLLNGVPSIIVGMLAWALVVVPMHGASGYAGSVALSVMLMPIVTRQTEQFLREVPLALREAALALGASKWKVIVTVVVPAASKGILTGIVLGVARIAGECAPLIFTAGVSQYWSDMSEQTASLPVVIYVKAMSGNPDWVQQAWAAALVLIGMVLTANIVARWILSRGVSVPRG
jgi:phosphate transport system permease protein